MPPLPRIFASPIATAVALLLCVGSATAQTLGSRLASPDEIHDMLVQRIDVQHKSGGIVVGVITKKAREIISYGHFDPADARVPDGDTAFEIGSLSKVFTSLLLADMVVKGEVKLSDPISKYLPASVHAPTRNGKQITLLDLATHYSGLPRMPSNFLTWDYSQPQMFDFLSHYELTRDPGQKFEYSNFAVGLLGEILALRAGTDYETLLRTRITGPLQMNHTAIHLTPQMKSDFIPGHGFGMGKAPGWEVPALAGAGGIRSTVNDLLIFLAANMDILQSPLQPAMKKMLTVHRTSGPGSEIALGWFVATGRNGVISHNGETNGYHSFMGYDPHRKVGVVVLSNSRESIDDIAWRIFTYPVTGPVEQQVGPAGLSH
jgi:D-alanyl-D-alanine-carboxypeptidase/D-alanyl-D-alanine-endopeptidase